MIKLIRWTQNYLLISVPFVGAAMVWSTLAPVDSVHTASRFDFLREVLSWNLMLWFAVLFLFLLGLVVGPRVREFTLARLAQVKERDEREEYITGKAAKHSFISTMSILILFLFLSTFTLEIFRVPESQAINGKRGTVSIGMHFNILDTAENKIGEQTSSRNPGQTDGSVAGQTEMLFQSRGLPASKAALILVFLIWQLSSFHLAARKESLADR